MAESALGIQYALPDESGRLPRLRVMLEPEFVDTRDNLTGLGDVDAMLVAAMSGISARSRQLDRCRWLSWDDTGEAVVTMELYVWPSQADLQYTLELPAGVSSSPAEVYTRSRTWKYWISGGSNLDLPWRLEPANAYWHASIGCLDEWSRQIAPPAVQPMGASLEMDGEAYGVLVVEGTAHGYRHLISIRLQKLVQDDAGHASGQELNRIEIDKIPVTAKWTDEDGEVQSTSENMAIPACVRDLLADCGGRPESFFGVRDLGDLPRTVYYDDCIGDVLLVVRAKK